MIEISIIVLCSGVLFLLLMLNKLNNQVNELTYQLSVIAIYLAQEKLKKEENKVKV